jgi:hypothetical protein
VLCIVQIVCNLLFAVHIYLSRVFLTVLPFRRCLQPPFLQVSVLSLDHLELFLPPLKFFLQRGPVAAPSLQEQVLDLKLLLNWLALGAFRLWFLIILLWNSAIPWHSIETQGSIPSSP